MPLQQRRGPSKACKAAGTPVPGPPCLHAMLARQHAPPTQLILQCHQPLKVLLKVVRERKCRLAVCIPSTTVHLLLLRLLLCCKRAASPGG